MTRLGVIGPEGRPMFLRRLSTDEYPAQPYSEADRRVLASTFETLETSSERTARPVVNLVGNRAGTAAGLLALNQEWGARFFEVPAEAVDDEAAAMETFAGRLPVIDVQTHFMAPHSIEAVNHEFLENMYRAVMPDWWTELDDLVKWDLAFYIKNVFLETDTAIAVLTSGPGLTDDRTLFNDEMAAARALFENFSGSRRVLNHAVVHADIREEVEMMSAWKEAYDPVGWKVYTPGRVNSTGWTDGWMLDDEEHGFPFLERARQLGVKLVCAHKGISMLVDNGSPRDIGPAAKAFPDLEFVIYHSGYEFPTDGAAPEGPYTDATATEGVNRLIASVEGAGLPPAANVSAELGSTWFSLVRRPVEAAHVLGKLIKALGPDNVVWGTDSIWYGAAQPVLDALRVFQIPEDMCEKYGYEPITEHVKDKILSHNAARLYGIDLAEVERQTAADDLGWAKLLLQEFKSNGFPGAALAFDSNRID